jgi:hypothetical protein
MATPTTVGVATTAELACLSARQTSGSSHAMSPQHLGADVLPAKVGRLGLAALVQGPNGCGMVTGYTSSSTLCNVAWLGYILRPHGSVHDVACVAALPLHQTASTQLPIRSTYTSLVILHTYPYPPTTCAAKVYLQTLIHGGEAQGHKLRLQHDAARRKRSQQATRSLSTQQQKSSQRRHSAVPAMASVYGHVAAECDVLRYTVMKRNQLSSAAVLLCARPRILRGHDCLVVLSGTTVLDVMGQSLAASHVVIVTSSSRAGGWPAAKTTLLSMDVRDDNLDTRGGAAPGQQHAAEDRACDSEAHLAPPVSPPASAQPPPSSMMRTSRATTSWLEGRAATSELMQAAMSCSTAAGHSAGTRTSRSWPRTGCPL